MEITAAAPLSDGAVGGGGEGGGGPPAGGGGAAPSRNARAGGGGVGWRIELGQGKGEGQSERARRESADCVLRSSMHSESRAVFRSEAPMSNPQLLQVESLAKQAGQADFFLKPRLRTKHES
jgi:hypothetical protein